MKIIRKDDVTPVAAQGEGIKGVSIRAMITDKDGAENFALRVFDVEPSGNTPFHTHSWEHEVYIISGSGKVKRENDSVDIDKGTALFIPADEKHSFLAGEDGLSFICVIPAEKKCCVDK
jgi:quercetin dioxygenase-like cupin family protein